MTIGRPAGAHDPRHPRDLHPAAWWSWALGLGVAASRTDNPVLLVLLALVAGLVVTLKRTDAPWARAYALFVRIALVVLALRVLFQAVLATQTQGTHVLVDLPLVPLPDWVIGIKLGGEVTWEALLSSLYAGGQLAVILVCFGAANALAAPRRMLRLAPAALYEVQVALVVALTFAPQLVVDARRVHNARRLRGRRVRARDFFRTTAMPVLESALDRSVDLAAAMDARGYGRMRHLGRRRRLVSGLSVLGSLGLLIGLYGLLSASIAPALSLGGVLGGTALVTAALLVGRSRAIRTRYRPDPWALPEWLVTGSGVVVAGTLLWCSLRGVGGLTMPSALSVPPLHPVPLAAVLIGLLPALVAPDPPYATVPEPDPRVPIAAAAPGDPATPQAFRHPATPAAPDDPVAPQASRTPTVPTTEVVP